MLSYYPQIINIHHYPSDIHPIPRVPRRYGFLCQCLRCQFEGDGPESCTHCGVKANDSQQQQEVGGEGSDEDDDVMPDIPSLKQTFPTCSRCKRAWYCSPGCQKEAWKKGHKKICVKV